MPSPIALFVYNRPDHTRRTVEALLGNALADESDLFIYADAPKNPAAADAVAMVRSYVHGVSGFKSVTVIERETNWGVDASIVDGVTMLCEQYGSVIVVEDDLVTSRWFLRFMNDALWKYRDDVEVMQVTGFMFPIGLPDDGGASFQRFVSSWGWATWKRAWNHFDPAASGYAALKDDKRRKNSFDLNGAYRYFEMLEQYIEGKLDAWDIRWYLTVFDRNGLILFPHKSLVTNIGFDGSGVHCPPSDFAGNELSEARVTGFPPVAFDQDLALRVERYLRGQLWSASDSLALRIRRKFASVRKGMSSRLNNSVKRDAV